MCPDHPERSPDACSRTAQAPRQGRSTGAPPVARAETHAPRAGGSGAGVGGLHRGSGCWRSEEHTSELQSRLHLVCRLLLEKKKITKLVDIHECRQRWKIW